MISSLLSQKIMKFFTSNTTKNSSKASLQIIFIRSEYQNHNKCNSLDLCFIIFSKFNNRSSRGLALINSNYTCKQEFVMYRICKQVFQLPIFPDNFSRYTNPTTIIFDTILIDLIIRVLPKIRRPRLFFLLPLFFFHSNSIIIMLYRFR